MNLGGDGPFQQWNAPDRWDWLWLLGMLVAVFGGCVLFNWFVGV
jgi:hypothetical protein